MSQAQTQANVFVAACKAHGFTWSVKGGTVVAVTKAFKAGDRDAFVTCDMDAPSLLSMVPGKGGSIWGTDGGSVGGHVALTHGLFELNKSGVGARFIAALVKVAK